jgi:hypothetical protein
MTEKTHWLQNPNKNYLGHWDLPSGKDVILTIASAAWEEVKNPITNTKDAKRVIRFVEKLDWIKPFICNQVNAQTILKSINEKYMEDCAGKRIKISISQTRVKGEEVDCLRVLNIPQNQLQDKKVTDEQVKTIQESLDKTEKSAADICRAYKVESLKDLPEVKFEGVMKTLTKLIGEANGNN